MSAQHTQGPLIACEHTDSLHAIRDGKGRIVADVGYSATHEINCANARRIAACWNACAGIPQDWLERGLSGCLQNVREERDAFRQQRDTLLAAARAAEAVFATQYWREDETYPEAVALRMLRAAIAQTES